LGKDLLQLGQVYLLYFVVGELQLLFGHLVLRVAQLQDHLDDIYDVYVFHVETPLKLNEFDQYVPSELQLAFYDLRVLEWVFRLS